MSDQEHNSIMARLAVVESQVRHSDAAAARDSARFEAHIDKLYGKIDGLNARLLVLLGGLIVNLAVLLFKS